jgi:hypothetical protein
VQKEENKKGKGCARSICILVHCGIGENMVFEEEEGRGKMVSAP